ncbi:YqeG family HAD IIIA-type phosphatase [bacterium]|nr:YqeG family HAD IIIA-type phosphatase [bacterium]MBQ9149894.1 YqeG family HAD IIIA-type phosphatase [bacterium]
MFLIPNYNIESIYDIDIAELKSIGIKALFFDLDSTLMKSKSGKFSFQTVQFLNDLKTNFKLAIITNNRNINYINKAKSQTDVPIYYEAKKPNPSVLLRACKDFNLDPQDVAMVGDRPLSDILGGLNAGMVTILVDSISKDEENFIVRFARFLERLTIKKQ